MEWGETVFVDDGTFQMDGGIYKRVVVRNSSRDFIVVFRSEEPTYIFILLDNPFIMFAFN